MMSMKRKKNLELDKVRYEKGFYDYQTLYFVNDSDYKSEYLPLKISHLFQKDVGEWKSKGYIQAPDISYLNRCFDSYLALSIFFQGLFISKNGYIIDTGNFETANTVMIEKVKEKVERHPLLWKLFFMIA